MEYLTAKQIIGKLKQGRVTDISEAYFSQMVRDGHIPFHKLPGKKRKHYLYDEVKQALSDVQDPSRDSQREAVVKAKEEKVLSVHQEKMNNIDKHYKNIISFMDDIVNLSEQEYKDMLLLDQSTWEDEDIEKCYKQDMESINANSLFLEALDNYLDRIKEPNNMRELDLMIKEILVYSMLDQGFLSLNLDKLEEGV